MKISNSQEANQYYKIVNDLVDQYIKKWKIKPTSLNKYLKPGSEKFESFILNSGLSSIDGIKRIVQDVIEDRQHMELDGVLTFESFISEINESTFEIGKSTVEHEKVLADFFNSSLGHIDIKDADKHSYVVNDFGDKISCIIYSEDELKDIQKKLIEESFVLATKKSIVIDNYTPYVHLKLEDIISEDKFKESYKSQLSQEKLIQIVSQILDAKYKKEFKGYHIWTF